MNFSSALFPLSWLMIGNTIVFLILSQAAYRVYQKRQNYQNEQFNAWMGICVFLAVLWSIRAGFQPGLSYHLLGATLLTLLSGPWFALWGMAFVIFMITLYGMSDWFSFGLNFLVMGCLPILTTVSLLSFSQKKLPSHFFVYIFVNAFVAGGFSLWLTGFCAVVLLGVSGSYAWEALFTEKLPYYLLLGWSEAFTTGVLTTLIVVYRPEWSLTFDDKKYLLKKE